MTVAPKKATATQILLTVASIVIIVAGMKAAGGIIVPFLLALFIAVIASPPLLWMESHGLHRALAMLVVIAVIVGIGYGIVTVVSGSLKGFSQDLPLYKERLQSYTDPVVGWLEARGVPVPSADAPGVLDPKRAMQLAADMLNGFSSVLANAFLIFLTVVFILFESASFRVKLRSIFNEPDRSLAEVSRFTRDLNRYLAIKTWTSLATGMLVGLWLSALGVEYAVLWAMAAFLLNYVPNIGSIIAAIPAVLLALIQLGLGGALWTAAGYLVINVAIGSFIEPKFLGRGLGLSTLVVFLSLVFWGWVLGPVGMFLSVPLTMAVKIALDSREDTRWIATLLGTAPPPATSKA